jgi:mRNA interferase MazF
MTKHLTIYDPFSVIIIPFPFTDSPKTKRRPAVVLSTTDYQEHTGHITLLMITSALHNPWFGDHQIKQLSLAGLEAESIIRQKIFTVDVRLIIREIGKLSPEDSNYVIKNLKNHIALKH